jgi:hypothetical protein
VREIVGARVRAHAIDQPLLPRLNVLGDVGIRETSAEPVEIVVGLCVVQIAERERPVNHLSEQIPFPTPGGAERI